MKAQIKNIRRIERNSEGETINLIIIDTTIGKTIVRRLKQFAIDLDNSGRLINVNPESIVSVKQGALVRACAKLRGGFVENFETHKKGDTYTIEAGHPALTNPDHPMYGKYQEGTKVPYEQDGTHVKRNEFLLVTPSIAQLQIEETAEQQATLNAELNGMFGYVSDASNTTADSAIEDFEQEFEAVEEGVVEEAIATKPTKETKQ